MSFFVSRRVPAGSRARADVFARGAAAVLVVAGGEAPDALLERVKECVLDDTFDLLSVPAWQAVVVDAPATLVVLVPGSVLVAASVVAEAWVVHEGATQRLASGVMCTELEGRLVVATASVLQGTPALRLAEIVDAEPFGRVADVLVGRAAPGSDDLAILVAER